MSETKKPPLSLHDFKAKRGREHIERMKELFLDNPDMVKDVLIVTSDGNLLLTPEGMTVAQIVGILECAKHELLFNVGMEAWDEEEDDSS